MKIKVIVSVGLVGCRREETIEVDDDQTDEDLEEIAKEQMFEMIEWTWKRVPE